MWMKMVAGIYFEFAINLMGLCLIMRNLAFMMVYMIGFNKLIREERKNVGVNIK